MTEFDLFPEDKIKVDDGITCPKCGSRDNYTGYGFAAGGLGGYTLCNACGVTLEFHPDPEMEK
jgi:hypothetical protein